MSGRSAVNQELIWQFFRGVAGMFSSCRCCRSSSGCRHSCQVLVLRHLKVFLWWACVKNSLGATMRLLKSRRSRWPPAHPGSTYLSRHTTAWHFFGGVAGLGGAAEFGLAMGADVWTIRGEGGGPLETITGLSTEKKQTMVKLRSNICFINEPVDGSQYIYLLGGRW